MFYIWIFTFSRYDFLPKQFQSVHEFQEAWFSLKISRHLVFTLMQKSSCAWNTNTKMSQKLNWIIKKIILIFVLQVFPQKRQLDVKISVWFPWFYQIFRETSAIVIVVTNNVSNVA